MSDDRRRVMVTGIGLMTAIGQGAAPTWENLLEGRSGIGPLRAYDPSPLRTGIGAEIPDFDPKQWANRRTLRMLCRGDQLALAGATLALRDAGLDGEGDLGQRTGLFLGSNKEMPRMDELIAQLQAVRAEDGTPDLYKLGQTASSVIAPLFFVEGLQPAAGFHISEKYGIRGANAYFAGTADAGAMAIGRGMRTVRRGEADIVLAGGYDDATGWWAMSKMDGLGVLSTRTDLGQEAFRPFDRDRSGSVFGEGAALLVLEEREHALARGAHCYAEVTGYGAGNDCVRPPSPQARARGLSRAIVRALDDAGGVFHDGGYIAAHGCATVQGDASETLALHDALGTAAKAAQISSIKPQTGHLVGGAGALNAAVSALALNSGVVPATQNLHHPADECDLDYVPLTPRETRPDSALALARGLEGQAVAIAMGRAS
ncbi:beta-ketoacyl-[acyl-carrier-protein] synthase family protein [Streptomyces sp. NBC_01264]|uniref:beta-ketoacyl-[acyl-carrier-protein] synthase family protein n=1 Tax=Streptomyces sp. NBC_01264 TaxID=2903804 RepID=UPI0022551A3F|nr:beta-ketoacyl-[acyl-carrier-protein] synthase family protein [Streptomyces sp. NBC_01264]MCX4783725.1 beta-ketoacyl-[acyl-carrier-protein] synthase family protein [Streptomyces sp. NBC_01264]